MFDNLEEIKRVCYTNRIEEINNLVKNNDIKELAEKNIYLLTAIKRYIESSKEFMYDFHHLPYPRKTLIHLYSLEENSTQS